MPRRREFYRELEEIAGPKGVAFFNLIEVVTYRYFEGRRDRQDAEAIAALQTLRRVLSPLHIPSSPLPAFAEYLKKEYEAYLKDHPEEIASEADALPVLDRTLAFITEFSGTAFQSRRFLTGLVGYVKTYHPTLADQLRRHQEKGRIILAGTAPPPTTWEPHGHGPGCQHHHEPAL